MGEGREGGGGGRSCGNMEWAADGPRGCVWRQFYVHSPGHTCGLGGASLGPWGGGGGGGGGWEVLKHGFMAPFME